MACGKWYRPRGILVEDGDFALGIFTQHHLGMAQGVVRSVGLDLINDIFRLHGQVFREGAGFLVGEDEVQVFGLE